VFFKNFHDAKKETVLERIPIIKFLLENKHISEDDFIGRFSFAVSKSVEFDSPNLPEYMARIFLDYASIFPNAKLTNLNLEEVSEDYMVDLLSDFCSDLTRKLAELVKTEQYAGLADRFNEAEILSFKEYIENWKEKALKKE